MTFGQTPREQLPTSQRRRLDAVALAVIQAQRKSVEDLRRDVERIRAGE